MHLTSHITHSNGYAPYIAYYRSNGFDQRFRKLKPKPKLNPPNAHRSQIKICENRQTQNVQFRFMPNAFRILKPIQKSSKRVWVFRNTGSNAFAKNQMRLAYEDKRDLYCMYAINTPFLSWPVPNMHDIPYYASGHVNKEPPPPPCVLRVSAPKLHRLQMYTFHIQSYHLYHHHIYYP